MFRLSTWLLFSVAFFVVVSHICIEPFHVHAGTITTHPAHGEEEESGHARDHAGAAHVGSCEVLRADAVEAQFLVIPPNRIQVAMDDPPTRVASFPARLEPALTGSPPPLFLLHAALLI